MRPGERWNRFATFFVVSPVASTLATFRCLPFNVRSQSPKSIFVAAISAGPALSIFDHNLQPSLLFLVVAIQTLDDESLSLRWRIQKEHHER